MTEPARAEPLRMTVAEFLAWDDGTDTRHELVDGVVTAMAPPGPSHGRIAGNLAVAIGRRLAPPCGVHTEHGLALEWGNQSYYQADLAVICADVQPSEPAPDPVVVVEVVSRSSAGHDRGRKAPDYRRIVGCRCILIVHGERRWVERWAREGERWVVQDHIGEAGPVPVDGLGLEVDLAEIYAGVRL